MRRFRRAAAVVAAAVTVLAAACGSPGPAPTEVWAGRVDRWLRNSQEALAAGVPNLSRFLSPDVVVDRHGTAQGTARGRDAALALYRSIQSITVGSALRRPAYLSPAGLVVLAHWRLDEVDSGQDAALAMAFSDQGLRHETSALSVVSGRWRATTWRTGALPRDWEVLETLAGRYVDTWSAGDAAGAAGLYAPGATVRDALTGLELHGRDDVASRVRGPRATMRLEQLPDLGGPAVFGLAPPLRDRFRTAVVLVRADAGDGCPGRLAVVLQLDRTGAITHEERYHRLDDARRCLPASARPHGWWDHLPVPPPVELERTGTVAVGTKTIEIWNGTPQLVGLVRWALDRYRAAGLEPPAPASITFYPTAPDRCGGYAGLASGPGLTELTLCFGTEAACRGSGCTSWAAMARQLLLHELAHTWLTQHVDAATEQRYADAVHLAWWQRDAPWQERAVERAADTITWALDPEHPGLHEFGWPSGRQLAAEYRLLTGRDPP